MNHNDPRQVRTEPQKIYNIFGYLFNSHYLCHLYEEDRDTIDSDDVPGNLVQVTGTATAAGA